MYQKLIIISLYAICFVTSCTSNYELGSSKYTSKVPKGMTAFEVMLIFGARGEDSFTKKEISELIKPFKYLGVRGDSLGLVIITETVKFPMKNISKIGSLLMKLKKFIKKLFLKLI